MRRRFAGRELLIATHNAGKLAEMRELLAPHGIVASGAADHGLAEPDETEDTFVGNARIKARAAVAATGLPALSDDSGIEVEALNGAPGVRTADWAETPEGRDFALAMTRTHDALIDAGATPPWRARFCATLVLAWPDGHEEVFEGTVNGTLVWPPRGDHGHGYDPMFRPRGFDTTFAEMGADRKNRISHRAIALKALIEECLA